jgi:hypothetical protein
MQMPKAHSYSIHEFARRKNGSSDRNLLIELAGRNLEQKLILGFEIEKPCSTRGKGMERG